MSNKIDVQKLATLARIEVDEKQAAELESSITNILEFVSDITNADVPEVAPADRFRLVKNRLRADENPDEPGNYKAEILRVAPKTKDDLFQVPKMINRKK